MLSSYVPFPPSQQGTTRKNKKRRVFCCTRLGQFTLTASCIKQHIYLTVTFTTKASQPI